MELPDHIAEDVKLARLQKLIDRQLALQGVEKNAYIGREIEVLVTGKSRDNEEALLGRSEHNGMVVFIPEGSVAEGDVVRVRFDSLVGGTFRGTQVQ